MTAPPAVLLVAFLGTAGHPHPTLPDDLQLVWRAPDECPERDFVAQSIAEALADGSGETRPVAAEAVVVATLEQDAAGFQLDLEITTEGTVIERSLRGEDCTLLARATGLVVGISLDSAVPTEQIVRTIETEAAALAPPDDEEAIVAAADPTSQPTAPADPPVATDDPRRFDTARSPGRAAQPLGAALRLAGGLDLGMLPGPGGGLAASLSVFGDLWRVSAHGSRWFARDRAFETEPTIGADFSAWSAGARGCFVPHAAAFEFPACGGIEFAQVRAVGFGGPDARDLRSLWLGGALTGGAEWVALRWLGVFANLEAFVAMRRPGFTAPQRPSLFRAAPVAFRAMLGVALRLGGPERAASKNR